VLNPPVEEPHLCNLCGCSLILEPNTAPEGLVGAEINGGFHSTPGNGSGALDDATKYKFSLCEFCLDWLFKKFRLPPKVVAYGEVEEYRPADQRVAEDEWRRMKDTYYAEAARRNQLRGKLVP
jgi:hypothetical protein